MGYKIKWKRYISAMFYVNINVCMSMQINDGKNYEILYTNKRKKPKDKKLNVFIL